MTDCTRQKTAFPGVGRRGYVLIVVMLVVVVLSLAAYRFADAMGSANVVAFRNTEAAQAKCHAVSGIHYAIAALNDPATLTQILGGNPGNNADYFSNIAVDGIQAHGGGRFALLNLTDSGGAAGQGKFVLQYGLIDEGGKININSLMRIDRSGESLKSMLGLLPAMDQSPDLPAAIVSWMTPAADQPAEAAPVSELYLPKYGPLSTVDELLFVPGMTPDKLYGNDRNRNGRQDPGEADGNDFNRGWSDFLTVYGHELNVDTTGAPRVFLQETLSQDWYKTLTDAVGQEMADYITAYRLYGGQSSITPLSGSNTRTGTMADLSAALATSLQGNLVQKKKITNSAVSLLNTRVALPRPPGSPPNTPTTYVNSPLNDRTTFAKYLPILLDKTTTRTNFEMNPRININTAPEDLLRTLPGLTADDVAAAITARATLQPGTAEYATGAWMVTQAGQRPEVFQQIERFITGSSLVYRVHALGYFARGGPVARVEAVIDTNGGKPRILYFRDLTDIGSGFVPPR
jgi:type II secretory pathway component PulK